MLLFSIWLFRWFFLTILLWTYFNFKSSHSPLLTLFLANKTPNFGHISSLLPCNSEELPDKPVNNSVLILFASDWFKHGHVMLIWQMKHKENLLRDFWVSTIWKAVPFLHFWVLWEYEDLELLQSFCHQEANQPQDVTYMLRLAEQKDRNDS